MKQKGFTLIELLAVIVVLAIIAIIAIPIITSVIDKAKVGALKDSAYGILEAGELYLAKNMSEGITDTIEFICSNGKCINGDKEITYKGQIETGRIRIYSDNKIELCITDNKNSALKTVDNKEIIVETGTCKYDELSYDVSALVSKDDFDELQREYNELLNVYNNGKSAISQVLIDKGEDVSTSDSFEDMSNKIASLSTELILIDQNAGFFVFSSDSSNIQKYTKTYDIKLFTDKYKELTVDNFIVELVSNYYLIYAGAELLNGSPMVKPKEVVYDSETGTLKVSLYYVVVPGSRIGNFVNIWLKN